MFLYENPLPCMNSKTWSSERSPCGQKLDHGSYQSTIPCSSSPHQMKIQQLDALVGEMTERVARGSWGVALQNTRARCTPTTQNPLPVPKSSPNSPPKSTGKDPLPLD